MPTNHYFGEHRRASEQRLLESLTRQAIQIKGQDMYYIPKEVVSKDEFFNESLQTIFERAYLLDFYIASVQGFEGQGDFLKQWGLQINDTATLEVSKIQFEKYVCPLKHPREGDLIYFPLSGGLFEITFVEHENPFYQLGKNYKYVLTVELFKYGQEDFNTGVDLIDDIADQYDLTQDETNDPFADNVEIEDIADEVLEFDETNPFGEP